MGDATIRLRIDGQDAKRSLADLRADMAKTAASAGQISMGMSGGIGSMGLGQLAGLGAMGFGAWNLGRNVASGVGASTRALTEGASGMLEQLIMGSKGFSSIKGDLAALDQVKQTAALAVGYGAKAEGFRGLFGAIAEREGKRAAGELQLQTVLGADIGERALTAFGERIVNLLSQLLEAVKPEWMK